jgi:hypothetical protein
MRGFPVAKRNYRSYPLTPEKRDEVFALLPASARDVVQAGGTIRLTKDGWENLTGPNTLIAEFQIEGTALRSFIKERGNKLFGRKARKKSKKRA